MTAYPRLRRPRLWRHPAATSNGAGGFVVVWVFVAFAVLVILGAALVLTGRADPGTVQPDEGPPSLQAPVTAEAVRSLRFRVGLRGYRMEDVDAALAAIAADLESEQGGGDRKDFHDGAGSGEAEGATPAERTAPDGGDTPAS